MNQNETSNWKTLYIRTVRTFRLGEKRAIFRHVAAYYYKY